MTHRVDVMKKYTDYKIPIPVKRALRKLGDDIRNARRRRRIPAAVLAERASIGRATLVRIEKGEPTVSLGAYASVLFSLGLIDRLSEIADVRHDERGLAFDEENLPERIHRQSRKKDVRE